MKAEELIALTPEQLQRSLPRLLAQNLTDPQAAAACEKALSSLVSGWDAADSETVLAALRAAGSEKRLYPAHPLCRAVSRGWAEHVITSAQIEGAAHLREAAEAGPVVLLSNHASYIDSPLLDALIARCCLPLADRVVHVAGPKVYQAIFRRLAIICLNAIPVQQSATVAKAGPDGAVPEMSARELAREVQKTLLAAEGALHSGGLLLLYPEGSRTRDGRLGPFLRGTYRYLRVPGTRVVPVALEGSGDMMGVSGDFVTPHACRLSFGVPISVSQVGGARAALELCHERVAELLPTHMQPLPS